MSPNAVNDLATSFVQMARAFEELPGVKEALDNEMAENDTKSIIIQRLETKLMDAKNLEETLRQSIRDLEVARDDAELRFLELEDISKRGAFLLGADVVAHLTSALEVAKTVMEGLDPPKPPTPTISEVKPIAVDPTVHLPSGNESEIAQPVQAQDIVEPNTNDSPQGQSEPLPTSAPDAPTGTGTESIVLDTDLEPVKYGLDGYTVTQAWWAWHERRGLD